MPMRLAAVVAFVLAASSLTGSASSQPLRTTGTGLLAYSSELAAAEVYAMNADGSGVRRLTDDAAPDRWPDLSPDGTRIAYARKSSGSWHIFIETLSSGAVEDLSSEIHLPKGFEGYPDWSPDGRKLAFSAQMPSQDSGTADPIDVLVYNFDAPSLIDLTPNEPADSMRPRWSPDGTKIVYGRDDFRTGFDVYVVGVNTSNKTQLTSAPGWQFEPTWSPDGKQIAFTSYNNETTDIYVMNADGTNQRDITNTRTFNDTQPTWSAKGIAFRSDRTGIDGIYLMNGDGSAVHRLSPARTYDEDPSWSRDGKRIMFTSGRAAHSSITVANGDGTNARDVTSGPYFDTDPSWSPNGQRLAFTRSPSRARSDIYTMNANGGAVRNLTHGDGLNWGPAWSPDGTRIAFVRFQSSSAQLWLMNADGTHQHPLTNIGRWNDHPSWSPDGRRIVFSAQRNNRVNLYILDVGTARQHRLTTDTGNDRSPAWSPNGNWIAFVAQRATSGVTDIWLVRPDGRGDGPLTSSSSSDTAPAWTSDSSRILYSKDEFWGHDHDLYTVGLADGGRETLLSGLDWPEDMPAAVS
jgi:Tol biopolymer transport system component